MEKRNVPETFTIEVFSRKDLKMVEMLLKENEIDFKVGGEN